ncbi:MAG: hypothetical protein HYZ09_01260 [Candidatus Kerfeldbacteria bacterium]|nr:hypothetical protein [Candidatus Kerfeldbacteria bacterium]
MLIEGVALYVALSTSEFEIFLETGQLLFSAVKYPVPGYPDLSVVTDSETRFYRCSGTAELRDEDRMSRQEVSAFLVPYGQPVSNVRLSGPPGRLWRAMFGSTMLEGLWVEVRSGEMSILGTGEFDEDSDPTAPNFKPWSHIIRARVLILGVSAPR